MPNIHPIFVHFPFALLTLGLITDSWASMRGSDQIWKCGWWLQATGTIGLLIAVVTGILAGQSEVIPEAAREVFDVHQQAAFISAATFSALALWRLGARGIIAGKRRILFLSLYAAGVGTILFTGWYGGRLVFEYGVGVVGR